MTAGGLSREGEGGGRKMGYPHAASAAASAEQSSSFEGIFRAAGSTSDAAMQHARASVSPASRTNLPIGGFPLDE